MGMMTSGTNLLAHHPVFRSEFTGKERDAETGLDYFGARYYSGAQGRFISADWSAQPVPVPYADFKDPQTLNLYAYVKNNPMATADLDGHGDWWSPGGKKIGSDGASDGAVHVAEAKNVSMSNGRVDPSSSTAAYSFSGKDGNEIWNAVDRTRAQAFNPDGPDIKGNMHEEGFTRDGTGNYLIAPSGRMRTPNEDTASVALTYATGGSNGQNTSLAVHTHPGAVPGPNTMGGQTYVQDPSPGDKQIAAKYPNVTHAVAGSQDEQLRIFDTDKKPKATIPLSAFPKCQKNGGNCF